MYVRLRNSFLTACGAVAILVTIRAVSFAQMPEGSIAGTWQAVGAYCGSGAAIPFPAGSAPTRLTIAGVGSGIFMLDRPLQYGDKDHVQINCRGTVKSNFTIVHLGGARLLRLTSGADIAGPACGPMAGTTTKLPDDGLLVEVHDDTLTTTTGIGPEDAGLCRVGELMISIYKRLKP